MSGTNKLPNWRRKLSVQLLDRSKQLLHFVKDTEVENLLFIFGCQRSGTTIIQRIFEQDLSTKIYPEVRSKLSKEDVKLGLRLDPLDDIKKELLKQKAPLVIIKPLVESQNAKMLLDSFPNSKGIWMYRHFNDVAASKIKKSGPMSGVGDLRYIFNDTQNDWRNDQIPVEIRELIQHHFSEDMDAYDAAALYWYVRNQFYFQQALHTCPNMMLCKYDDLVGDSLHTMQQIYTFLERPYPNKDILIDIHKKSIGKGQFVKVSPEIELICQKMFHQLVEVDHAAQQKTNKVLI